MLHPLLLQGKKRKEEAQMHIFLSIFQPSGLSKCSSSYAENLTKWNNTLEIACMRKRDCQYQMIHTARLSREPKRHDQWQGCSAMLRALHNTAFKIGKCLYHTQSYQHTTMLRCQRNPIVITNHYHRLYIQECEEEKSSGRVSYPLSYPPYCCKGIVRGRPDCIWLFLPEASLLVATN